MDKFHFQVDSQIEFDFELSRMIFQKMEILFETQGLHFRRFPAGNFQEGLYRTDYTK